jgi:hypothetical protein
MRRHKEVVWEPVEGDKCSRCSGIGCCQAKIPLYYPSYDVELKRLDWHDDDIDQVTQNLVLNGEEGWIEKVWCHMVKGANVSGLKGIRFGGATPDLSMIPVVLEWAMNSTQPLHPGKAAG